MKVKCHYCKKVFEKANPEVNRARRKGLNIYCGHKCSGLGRRTKKTEAQKRAEKAEYDRKYRQENRARLKVLKADRFLKDYYGNPEKYRKERQRKRKAHAAYIKTDRYRKWKKEYDVKHRAKKLFGAFGESLLIIKEIETIIDKHLSRQDRGINNKKQKRTKLWHNLSKPPRN